MRKELYNEICNHLRKLYRLPDGSVCHHVEGTDVPEGAERIIKHIDLWNHNVEFIEQEENWARPAVFVEFKPIKWKAIVEGVEYRAEPQIHLHIVTDWEGAASDESDFKEEALGVFDLPELLHETLTGLGGEKFLELDLIESDTNHNHEDIVENIEIYQCVAIKRLK